MTKGSSHVLGQSSDTSSSVSSSEGVSPGLGSGHVPGPQELLRILVVRPDRIGDVILSTPVFETIKNHYSKAHLTALVKENVTPLLKGLPCIDHLMVFEPDGKHAGFKGFFRLCTEIRRRRFRIAIVLQSNWKIAAALFIARVQYRVGPFSKPHSYLFYNRGVRQRRSHVEMHETDYNLQLLRRLGIRVGSREIGSKVYLADDVKNSALRWLKERNWNSKKPLILVHPGMGGSALNWPESHYGELISAFVKEGRQVLVTAGSGDEELVVRIMQNVSKSVGPLAEQILLYKAKANSSIDFFVGLCHFADLVVAPSTGPMHIAVALDKRVVTFYPPVRVQSAIRWGPYLIDETKAGVLVPEVYCGQDFICIGNLCNYFPCMKGITVKSALDLSHKQIQSAISSRPTVDLTGHKDKVRKSEGESEE